MQQNSGNVARALRPGGYVEDYNLVPEHAGELLLSHGEQDVIRGLRYFQEQPQHQFCLPSVTALARFLGYTRAWVSHLLHGLMRPRYRADGTLERPAYIFKVLRPGKAPWYDLRNLVRMCRRFLKQEACQEQKTPPELLQIFAGWNEVDGAPGRTQQRLDRAVAVAGWSQQELKSALARAADKTTYAQPARHIAFFLKILEQMAEEDGQRRTAQREIEKMARDNMHYWEQRRKAELKEQRKRARQMLPAAPAVAAVIVEPEPALEVLPDLAPSQRMLLALGKQRDWRGLEGVENNREGWLAFILSQPLERLRRLHWRLLNPAMGIS